MIYDVLYHIFVVLSSIVVGAGIYRFGQVPSSTLRKIQSVLSKAKDINIYGGAKGGGMTNIRLPEDMQRSEKEFKEKGKGSEIDWGAGT